MMKNILIYINQICLRGGVEKVFYNLINSLDMTKYDITVLTTVAYLSDDLNLDLYKGKVKRFFFSYDEFSDNFLYRQYQRIYNKIAPKIIDKIIKLKKWDIAIAAQEGMYADYIKGVNADKKLLWIHNDMRKLAATRFGTIEQEKKCYEAFDDVVCVSEDVKKSMIEVFGDLDNLCVKYNPIDTNEIDLIKDQPVEEQRIYKEVPLLVSVGRLCSQKGYDRLLECVKRLNEENYKYEIWIVGEGADRELLEKYISDNNIDNVKLLGLRSNPYKYMNYADWVICTSRHEGFNMVLHEATYLEKPILTTNNAGAIELLGDSKFGIIIDNDNESIYNGLKNILDNKDLKSLYEKRVKKRKSFISLDERIKKIEELF